jgi:twitching motility protein PilU
MERDQASKFVNDLLRLMVSRNGSDLFLTADFPPAIKVDGKVTKVSPQPLTGQHTLALTRAVMNDKQSAEFERTKECNFAISPQGVGRFVSMHSCSRAMSAWSCGPFRPPCPQ